MKIIIAVWISSTYLVAAIPPPHPQVLAVSHQEQFLSPHLRKPALRNPRLWKVLPLTSLLHHGEAPVFDRQTDHISRNGIYSMLTHAGLIPRTHPNLWQPGQDQGKKSSNLHQPSKPEFFDVPDFLHQQEFQFEQHYDAHPNHLEYK